MPAPLLNPLLMASTNDWANNEGFWPLARVPDEDVYCVCPAVPCLAAKPCMPRVVLAPSSRPTCTQKLRWFVHRCPGTGAS
jgi:hypothetical protein